MPIKELSVVSLTELIQIRNECEIIRSNIYKELNYRQSARVDREEKGSNYSELEQAISKELKSRVDSYFIK